MLHNFHLFSEEEKEKIVLALISVAQPSTISKINKQLEKKLKIDFIGKLPIELSTYLLSFTDFITLGKIAQVNKYHKTVSEDNGVWRFLYKKNGWHINKLYLDNIISQNKDTSPTSICSSLISVKNYTITEVKEIDLEALDGDAITTGSLQRFVKTDDSKRVEHSIQSIENSSRNFGSENEQKCNLIDENSQLSEVSSVSKKASLSEISVNFEVGENFSTLNWKYIFHQRKLLERNWKVGKYTMREFVGHKEAVYCLQFDDEKVVSGGRDKLIRIWNIKTGQVLNTLNGHLGSVLCLFYNNEYLISGSSDSKIIIWNFKTGALLKILEGHTESVTCLKIYESSIVSCSKDKSIKIWDFETGKRKFDYSAKIVLGRLMLTMLGHKVAVNSIEVKNGLVVSGSGDRTIKVWDFKTGKLIKTLMGHSRGVACIQFDGNLIASGSSDKSIKIWDLKTGKVLKTLSGHLDMVRTLQFQNNFLISGSYDTTIKVWDLNSGTNILTLSGGHPKKVFKLAFDCKRILSCSQDSKLICWDFGSGVEYKFFLGKQ